VAVLFAREGADVAIVYLTSTRTPKQTRRAIGRKAARCLLIPGDVKDARSATARWARRCRPSASSTCWSTTRRSRCTPVAGGHHRRAPAGNPADQHRRLLPHGARRAAAHRAADASSTRARNRLFGNKALLDYSATKGAIHAFTKSLASNLLERGIRVNAVAPGPVWTPLNPADKFREGGEVRQASDMGRPAQPEVDLARPTYSLASPRVLWLPTSGGIVLPVMGGPIRIVTSRSRSFG
jgi:NAD(P)-dependent dehydrogenase (short-subunit alcohol dehydrogenase family)